MCLYQDTRFLVATKVALEKRGGIPHTAQTKKYRPEEWSLGKELQRDGKML